MVAPVGADLARAGARGPYPRSVLPERGHLGAPTSFTERGIYMIKFRAGQAVLAGAAVVALAGCSSSGSSSSGSGSAGGSGTTADGTSSAATSSAPASPSPGATSSSVVATGSIPFPIAVGNTWVYETTASINGEKGMTTNKVLSVVPVTGGNKVTMSETTQVAGSTNTTRPVFTFYSDGKVAYPVGQSGGNVSVVGGVIWPDATDLASGKTYHSVLRIKVGQSGPSEYQNEDVAVHGAGTDAITVPAGTFQATKVVMTIAIKVGGYTTTEEVDTWQAPGTGPVKSQVIIHAAGNTQDTSTEELLSFTKG